MTGEASRRVCTIGAFHHEVTALRGLKDTTPAPDFTVEDHDAACEGGPARLGYFMFDLVQCDNRLSYVKGHEWIACTREDWASRRKPWGEATSVATLDKVLAEGRKLGVLVTMTAASRFAKYEKTLHVRPADDYRKRLSAAHEKRQRWFEERREQRERLERMIEGAAS